MTASAISALTPGLLAEARSTSSELLAGVDDTIPLYQVSPRAKLHREAHCRSLTRGQVTLTPVAISFRALNIHRLCLACESGLIRAHERFCTPPDDPDERPVFLAVRPQGARYQSQLAPLVVRSALAAGPRKSEAVEDNPVCYLTVVPYATAVWMSSWAPYGWIHVLRRTTDTDTQALLDTARALWDPDDEGPLSDPGTALEAAASLLR